MPPGARTVGEGGHAPVAIHRNEQQTTVVIQFLIASIA